MSSAMTDPIYHALTRNPIYERTFPIEIRGLIFGGMHRVDRLMWKMARFETVRFFKWKQSDMIYCMSIGVSFATYISQRFNLDHWWHIRYAIISGNMNVFKTLWRRSSDDLISLASYHGQCKIMQYMCNVESDRDKLLIHRGSIMPSEFSDKSLQWYVENTHLSLNEILANVHIDRQLVFVQPNCLQWIANNHPTLIVENYNFSHGWWLQTCIQNKLASKLTILLQLGMQLVRPRLNMYRAIRKRQSLDLVKALTPYVAPIESDMMLALRCNQPGIFRYFVSIGMPVTNMMKVYARTHKLFRLVM